MSPASRHPGEGAVPEYYWQVQTANEGPRLMMDLDGGRWAGVGVGEGGERLRISNDRHKGVLPSADAERPQA